MTFTRKHIILPLLVVTVAACSSDAEEPAPIDETADENMTGEPLELSPEVEVALNNEALTEIKPEDYPANENNDAEQAKSTAETLASEAYGATLSKYKTFRVMVTPEAAKTAGVPHIDPQTASTAVDAIGYNWMVNAHNYKEKHHPDYVHGESDIIPVVDDMTSPNGGGFTAEEAIYALTFQP